MKKKNFTQSHLVFKIEWKNGDLKWFYCSLSLNYTSKKPFAIKVPIFHWHNEPTKWGKEINKKVNYYKIMVFSCPRVCNDSVLGMQKPCKSNCIFLSWNQSKFRQKLLYDWCDNNVSPFLFQQILVVHTVGFIVKSQLALSWIDKISDHILHQKE